MSTKLALTTSAGGAPFPEDVFSPYAYTGNATARSIQNGINLSAFGGLVWTKVRGTTGEHLLCDTTRGANLMLSTTVGYSGGSTTYANSVTGFNADGYSLGTSGTVNGNTVLMASWTFRKAKKFFDIVTYTGNLGSQTVNHSLGVAPGFILVKRTDATGNFFAYHRSAGTSGIFDVNNGTGLGSSTTAWANTAPTASAFFLGANSSTNASGASYVAYLFAHDASTDGIIQCGTYTGGGVGAGPTVTLGWEPQFILFRSGANAAWALTDSLRGLSIGTEFPVYPDTTAAEASISGQARPLPTGFRMLAGATEFNVASTTYYYVAIRRPMKRPTAGTQVFSPHTFTGNNTATNINTPGFPADMLIGRSTGGSNVGMADRLDGPSYGYYLNNNIGGGGSPGGYDLTSWANSLGYQAGSSGNFVFNGNGTSQANYAFKRATGFFDVVGYTGTGTAQSLTHSLGTTPELMLIFRQQTASNKLVYHAAIGNTKHMILNSAGTTDALPVTDSTTWNNTSPTSTQFTVGTNVSTNANGSNYTALLFASLAGISKVGSYTGNGGTQAIDCGFTTGARFVLIKRYDTTGAATNNYTNNWLIADTARGIGASNDPVACINTTTADSTSFDWLSANSTGFNVIQTSNTDTNVNGATYIFLAIA